MTPTQSERFSTPSLGRTLWRLVSWAHLIGALAWIWLLPGGFPLAHARFWANRGLPAAVVLAAAVCRLAAMKSRDELLRLASLAFPVLWTAAAVAAPLIFPVSGRLVGVVLLAVAAGLWGLYFFTFRAQRPGPAALVVSLFAVCLGIAAPWTQRAAEPATRPVNQPLPNWARTEPAAGPASVVPLADHVLVSPGEALVRVRGRLTVDVQPLLTFESRSPDRCWTSLAPRAQRREPHRVLIGLNRQDSVLFLRFRSEEIGSESAIRVLTGGPARSVEIDAWTELGQPVYSHLNTFTMVTVTGHAQLFLAFSPRPEIRVPVQQTDYPTGRPARLAYLDAAGRFHIVEARSGEKGPFDVLAAGELSRDETLTITLYDRRRAVCHLKLLDWAAQASTALSPTAGWGLPENAIEFSRQGEEPASPANLWITLSGTSVGRGWDSVGHAAGTYRNRVQLEWVGEDTRGE